jgi:hypothetical protein
MINFGIETIGLTLGVHDNDDHCDNDNYYDNDNDGDDKQQ